MKRFANSFGRRIAHLFFGRIHKGTLEIVENGVTTTYGSGSPAAKVTIHDPRAWRRLLRGGRGLGEGYMEGFWDTPDLTQVFRIGALNVEKIDRLRQRIAVIRRPWRRVRGFLVRNTPQRSRRDIEAHYDLGNELFSLMLDQTMMYSCGVFAEPDATLEEASLAKLELVCAKLDIGPGDHVVEVGTGWGGFAVYAARTRGCRVTTTTISKAQHEVALARVREEGLEELVEVRLDDYRDLAGRYDKLVSLEMIEAVGWKDFGTFFSCCSNLLEPDGAMLLQAITIDDRAYEVEKDGPSFIRTYIFPNGCLPSHEVIGRNVARHTDMRPLETEDLTEHYPETLRRWRQNFDASTERLEELGYDRRFRRLWRMYLQYCEAGFMERRIGVSQFVFAKPDQRESTPHVITTESHGHRSARRPRRIRDRAGHSA
jgi:cyclopropane-fatty-acyl-phospholipid synthase